MFKYELKEAKENPLESIVEKSGIKAEFSVQDLIDEGKRIEKKLQEIKGQLEIEDAKRQNIETNHSFVLEATPEEIEKAHHITLYREINQEVEKLKGYVNILEKAIQDNNEEIAIIKETLGFKETSIDSLNEPETFNE